MLLLHAQGRSCRREGAHAPQLSEQVRVYKCTSAGPSRKEFCLAAAGMQNKWEAILEHDNCELFENALNGGTTQHAHPSGHSSGAARPLAGPFPAAHASQAQVRPCALQQQQQAAAAVAVVDASHPLEWLC